MPQSPKDTKQHHQVIPANYERLDGSERRPSPTAKFLGPATAEEEIKVTIALRRRPDGPPVPSFESFANKADGKRRRLTADEFAAQYGALPADIARVTDFARAHGLKVVQTHAGRRTVCASGPARQRNEAFGVALGRYERSVARSRGAKSETQAYRGRDGFIHIPKDLAGIVIGVFGLDN